MDEEDDVICCMYLTFCGESNDLGKKRAAGRGDVVQKVVWRGRRGVEGSKPKGCGADGFVAWFSSSISVGEALDTGTKVMVVRRISGGFG